MIRARKPEREQELCGFVQDTQTRNAIFMIRNLLEQTLKMPKNLYL